MHMHNGTKDFPQISMVEAQWRRFAAPVVVTGLFWANLYFLVGENANLRALMLLFVTSSLGTYIVALTPIPGFVGALIVGVMVANIPPRFGDDIDVSYKSAISSIALVVILLRAGMGLNLTTVKSRIAVLTWVSLVPTTIDVVSAMLLARLFFTSPQIPWSWCALVGFVVPAVSPAVVVPGCLALQEEGYGVQKGVTTIVLAATALGDVFSIAGFSVCMSVVFQGGADLAWTIGKVPVEIIVGVTAGAAVGYMLTGLFPSTMPLSPLTRCILFLGFGGAALLGGKKIEWSAAGSLFVLVIGLGCSARWSKEDVGAINAHLVTLWNHFVCPILFATIGTAVDFQRLDGSNLAYACALILCTVCIRALCTTFSTPTCGVFQWREKGFMACAWMPKATVQAALASVPLDRLQKNKIDDADDRTHFGRVVLAVGVVAILMTAPAGAVLIKFVGRRWLTKGRIKSKDEETDIGDRAPKQNEGEPALSEDGDEGRAPHEDTHFPVAVV